MSDQIQTNKPAVSTVDYLKAKFQSRKWRIIVFWDILLVLALVAQSIIVGLQSPITLPVKEIVWISGVLNAGYFGINLWQKKIENPLPTEDPTQDTNTPTQ